MYKCSQPIGIALLVAVIALASLALLSLSPDGAVEAGEARSPIGIVGDAGFTSANGVVSGSGTAADPYIIEGWDIRYTDSHGVYIGGTTKHFILRNVTVRSPASNWGAKALCLDGVQGGGSVEYVSIQNTRWNSIYINDTHNFVFKNITNSPKHTFYFNKRCTDLEIYDLDAIHIALYNAEDCKLVRCRTTNVSPYTHGMKLTGCRRVTLQECNSSGNEAGIELYYCYGCKIDDCVLTGNTLRDLRVSGAGNKLTDNRFGTTGIHLAPNNTADTSNKVDGKPLRYYNNESHVRLSTQCGQVIICNSHHFTVEDLTFDGIRNPIYLFNVTQSTFRNLTVTHSSLALYAYYIFDSTFKDNAFDTRMYLDRTSEIEILGGSYGEIEYSDFRGYRSDLRIEDVTTHGLGIDLYAFRTNVEIENCSINGGRIISDTWVTMHVGNCTIMNSCIRLDAYTAGSVTIFRNTFINCSSGLLAYDFSTLLVDSNGFLNCTTYGIFAGDHDGIISNNTIEGSHNGIRLWGGSYTVENNTISNCDYGINSRSYSHTMKDNSISDCRNHGVLFSSRVSDSRSLMTDCTIVNCTVGVYIEGRSSNFTVTRCTISEGERGIYMDEPDDCTITWNTIMNFTGWGLDNAKGAGHSIHHNNFIRTNYNFTSGTYDGPQAFDSVGGTYHSVGEGNYWSDYKTRYPSARTSDGRVWDTPYQVPGTSNRYDPYPLVIMADPFPPVVDAGQDQEVDQGTRVTLDGSLSSDNLGIASMEWSFVYNGTPFLLKGAFANFTFDVPGTYNITLTAKDHWGNSGSDNVTVAVLDTQRPVADAGPDIVVDMNGEFVLDASASRDNVGIAEFLWVIDRGGLNITLREPVVRLFIMTPGRYAVELKVVDAAGNFATDALRLVVRDTIPPVADAGEDMDVDQDVEVTLVGSGSSDNVGIAWFNWSFEHDGEVVLLFGPTPVFVFTAPGEYTITLTVTDTFGNPDTDLVRVLVRDTEAPVAAAGEDVRTGQGEGVLFDASGSSDNVGVTLYRWTFEHNGSRVQRTGRTFEFTFWVVGEHLVTLRVSDAAENWAEDTVTVLVEDTTAPVPVTHIPATVDQNRTVVLDGSRSHDNHELADGDWSFDYEGEERVLEGLSPSFTFRVPGSYQLTLTVYDMAGNSASTEVTLVVRDTVPPVSRAPGDTSAFVGTTLRLDGSRSSDNVGISKYEWRITFGGITDTRQGDTIEYHFDRPGAYTISLRVHDAAGNSHVDSMVVKVKPLVGDWRLGPFTDESGAPVEGIKVTMKANGTIHEGETGQDGWVVLRVDWRDLVGPVSVKATKGGWKDLKFQVELDEDGDPVGDIPPMVKRGEEGSAAGAAFALVALLIPVVMHRRRGGP